MSFALDLGTDLFKVDEDDEDRGQLSAPFAWLMFMHCLFLGESDAGRTWLVLNILLHEFSPFLTAYEKIVVIGAEEGDVWYKLAKRFAPDKFLWLDPQQGQTYLDP